MTAIRTHSSPYHSWALARAARALCVASAAVAIAAGAYELSRTTHPHAVATAAATVHVLPLGDRVVPVGALPGYTLNELPIVIRTPAHWAASMESAQAAAAEAKRLRNLGFVAGIDERLHGWYPLNSEAISIVEKFRSVGGARAELAREYALSTTGSGNTSTRFSVIGVPGATGWEVNGPHGAAINVSFADGPFYYLIGATVPTNDQAKIRQEIVRAAQFDYLLAVGCVAPNPATQRKA